MPTGTWTLANPKGIPTENTFYNEDDMGIRKCSDVAPAMELGHQLGDEFGDCWGFGEAMPPWSICANEVSCRTDECNELCLPCVDNGGLSMLLDAPGRCCFQEALGECGCPCILTGKIPADFVLLSPTQAHYNWGTDRVLATLARVCPQDDYAVCISMCPSDSIDFDLCLETCSFSCPPSLNAATNDQANTPPVSPGAMAIAGIMVAAAVAGAVIVGSIYHAKKSKQLSGHDVQLLVLEPREQALAPAEMAPVKSFEVASV
jgi:hypothetical protein